MRISQKYACPRLTSVLFFAYSLLFGCEVPAVSSGLTLDLSSLTSQVGTWRVAQTDMPLSAVTHGRRLFVAMGENGAIFTSPNGLSRTRRSSGRGVRLYDVTFGGGLFVAVGDGEVAYGEGCFVVVSNNGVLLISR